MGWQCPACIKDGAKRSRQVPAFTHTGRGRSGVVGSTNPTPIVLAIVAVNVFVFVVFERAGHNVAWIDRFALWPAGIHAQQQYYRAFTAMWLHASFQHIFFNMLALLIVGPAVEVLLGKARFVALYLLAGLGGSVGSYLLSPAYELGRRGLGRHHGRDGGLRGHRRCAAGCRRAGGRPPRASTSSSASGATIDWRAHLGGFVTGCLVALLYDCAGSLARPPGRGALTVGGSVAVAAVLALLVTSVAPGHVNLG